MIYLDTNSIIYLIEGDAAAKSSVLSAIAARGPMLLCTSRLARLECRVKPLKDADALLLDVYDRFLGRTNLVLFDVSADVIDRATELRARYNFRTPDAIHLATALVHRVSVYLTGDKQLARCSEVSVQLI